MRAVTVTWLREQDACREQVATFRKEWGGSVTLTRAVLLRAVELRFDLGWWAERALSREQLAEYDKAVAPIDAEYWKKLAPIDAEHRKKLVALDAEYHTKLAAILAEVLGLKEDKWRR